MSAILSIERMSVTVESQGRTGRAVRDLSYELQKGETLSIVGESGSGKSLHALALMGLLPGKSIRMSSGRVVFAGQDISGLPERRLSQLRGSRIAMIFQDPLTSLNPVLTIGFQIREMLSRHLKLSRTAAALRACELLDLVGIHEPTRIVNAYPFELSGGMQQRVMIAMAISCNPEILIADEPTTALDVTIQGQIIDLLKGLRQRLGMAMIWITHDIGVVAAIADTVQVMYAGQVVERGAADDIFHDVRNAYTWSLLQAMPGLSHKAREPLQSIPGQPPTPFDTITGDPFAPRNPFATPRCFTEAPPLEQVRDGAAGHLAAAWYDLPAILSSKSPS